MGVKRKIYLVAGVPASGKSWLCRQLTGQFDHVAHDDYIGKDYVGEITKRGHAAGKPLLIETPFSVSKIREPLQQSGFDVTTLYVQEKSAELARRYKERAGLNLPTGHLTRQETYAQRAKTEGAFIGSSTDVLNRLRGFKSDGTAPAASEPLNQKWPWEWDGVD